MPLVRGNAHHLAAPLFAAVCLLTGCSCGAETDDDEVPSAVMRPNTPMEIVRDPILFGPDGKLRVSETQVGALVVPIGFRASPSATGVHVYDGLVPVDAVHAFYRARLVSSDIDEAGDHLHFANARPTTAQGVSNERFDVTIAPNGRGGVRLTIAPAPAPPPTVSEAEARRRINEALSRQARE